MDKRARRTPPATVARLMRQYHMGDQIRIIRGTYAGEVFTVHDSANDWVTVKEIMKKDPSRWVMSKRNVEPADGFTHAELDAAERASRKAE